MSESRSTRDEQEVDVCHDDHDGTDTVLNVFLHLESRKPATNSLTANLSCCSMIDQSQRMQQAAELNCFLSLLILGELTHIPNSFFKIYIIIFCRNKQSYYF